METIFFESCAAIEAEYSRLGHQLGWRFLASPRATLRADTRIALITMNPGGAVRPLDHGEGSTEAGSAYIVETWNDRLGPGQAALQIQVRRLFAMFAAVQGHTSGDKLLETSLAGYFVPFRSPTFKSLVQPKESASFACKLWSGLFSHIDPKLIVTIDQLTTTRLLQILCNKLKTEPTSRSFTTGWGDYEADLYSFASADGPRSVLRLPHLSRFRILGRAESDTHVQRMIEAVRPTLTF